MDGADTKLWIPQPFLPARSETHEIPDTKAKQQVSVTTGLDALIVQANCFFFFKVKSIPAFLILHGGMLATGKEKSLVMVIAKDTSRGKMMVGFPF